MTPTKAQIENAARIERLKKELAQAEARQAAALARERMRIRSAERTRDTRRKVLLGAYALEALGQASAQLYLGSGKTFAAWLVRADDRELFGLDPIPATSDISQQQPQSRP
ncbi:MAG: mobilization protein [Rubrivivax sp.]|jgi:hypothetical protein